MALGQHTIEYAVIAVLGHLPEGWGVIDADVAQRAQSHGAVHRALRADVSPSRRSR